MTPDQSGLVVSSGAQHRTGRRETPLRTDVPGSGTEPQRNGDPADSPIFAIPQWLERSTAWAWRLLVLAAAAVVVALLLARVRVVVVSVLVALLVAGMLGPPAARLRRHNWPSLLATWTVLLTAAVVIGGLLFGALALVVSELTSDSTRWRSIGDDVRAWLTTDSPVTFTDAQIDRAWESVTSAAISGAGGASDAARLLVEFGAGVFLGIVLTLFFVHDFVHDGESMWQWLVRRVAPARRDAMDMAGRRTIVALGGYVRGLAITGMVGAVLIGAVLFALGVPLALPLAIITLFGAFIPIVGATFAGSLAAIVALVTEGVGDAIVVALAILVIQQVEGDVVMPLAMRHHVRLHPAIVIVGITSGGALAGVIGAFLAVPAAAATVAVISTLRTASRRQMLAPEAVSQRPHMGTPTATGATTDDSADRPPPDRPPRRT